MKDRLRYISSIGSLPDTEIDRKVVFLSENVISESVTEQVKAVGYEIATFMWRDSDELKRANLYLEELYVRLGKKIGLTLSKVHEVDYPPSFWEIPMASWLLHYLHILFDRYSRLKNVIAHYGKENITLLSCKCDIAPPLNFNDFIETTSVIEQSVSSFYAVVAKKLGIPVLEFISKDKSPQKITLRKGYTRFFSKAFFVRIYDRLKDGMLSPLPLRFFEGRDILMSRYKFNRQQRLFFARKLRASFYPNSEKVKTAHRNIDRKVLSSILPEDDFEKIAVELLPDFMPGYLLEGFSSYKYQAERLDDFKIYFFVTDWWFNILFCYAASLGRLKGAKIVGCQHGGGYGQYKKSSVEFMERYLCDYYITWGWKDSVYDSAELLPLPQPFSLRYLNRHRQNLPTVILAGVSIPKHLYRFYSFSFSDSVMLYFKERKEFVSHLNFEIRKSLIFRPYHCDYGWSNVEKEILKRFPEVGLEYSGNFLELLQKVKLYICDHQGTSFLEALVVNTPTILFWNIALADERESAVPSFDLLRDTGILFYDSVKAAEQVNAIWGDIQSWWMHPDRQNARLKFIETFYRTDVKWHEKWIEAFRRIPTK